MQKYAHAVAASKTSCHRNGSDSPHCHLAPIIQSHSPGGTHMFPQLMHGFLGHTNQSKW